MVSVMRDLANVLRKAETYLDLVLEDLQYGFGFVISYEDCISF